MSIIILTSHDGIDREDLECEVGGPDCTNPFCRFWVRSIDYAELGLLELQNDNNLDWCAAHDRLEQFDTRMPHHS